MSRTTKTAVASDDRRDPFCTEQHPEVRTLRCWKRASHNGMHLTVLPNKDPKVKTRPQAVRW